MKVSRCNQQPSSFTQSIALDRRDKAWWKTRLISWWIPDGTVLRPTSALSSALFLPDGRPVSGHLETDYSTFSTWPPFSRGGEKILFSTVSLNNCISVVVCWGSIDNTVSADFPPTIPRYSRAAKTLPSEKVKLFHHCKKCKAYKGIYYFQKVACLCVIADNRRPAWQVKTTIFRECRSKDQRKSGDAN